MPPKKPASAELELTDNGVRVGGKTYTWRTILVVLVLASTGPGQRALDAVGITWLKAPNTEKAEAIRDDMTLVKYKLAVLVEEVGHLRLDMDRMKEHRTVAADQPEKALSQK